MENIITSKDNKYLKIARSLAKKKYRQKEGLFLIEGTRNCYEAVISQVHISYILVKQSKYNNPQITKILTLINNNHNIFLVEDKIFATVSNTEESQGIIIVAKIFEINEEIFAAKIQDKNIAILDGLQDPGNIGTILRTAWAAGLGGIISVNNSADIYNPKIIRSAMGAVYNVPFIQMSNEEAQKFLQKQNYVLAVADAEGIDYKKFKCDNKKIAWLLGSEGNGVSDFWRNKADTVISIPMAPSVESLNVAVAAGILFFSQTNFEK